jgi:uncharacterized protein (DUF1697 family)
MSAGIDPADLTSAFQARGFEHVETVLITGNVVFETDRTNTASLTGEIADLFLGAFSPEVLVILRKWITS